MLYANLLLNVLYHIEIEMKIRESCLQTGNFIYKPGISLTKQDFHLQRGSLGLQRGFSGYYLPSICATRVTYLKFDNNMIASYNDWISEYDKLLSPSKRLLAVGVGGILYPPHIFPNEVFNKAKIIELALTADDIWLKFMELKNNIPVVWSGQLPQHPKQIPNTRDVGLWRTVNKYKNDEYIQNLMNAYGMDLFSLITEGEDYNG